MKLFKNKKGITLVELLAVLVILGIIAAIAVPTVTTLISNTQRRADIASANSYVDSARLYALENNNASFVTIDTLNGRLANPILFTADNNPTQGAIGFVLSGGSVVDFVVFTNTSSSPVSAAAINIAVGENRRTTVNFNDGRFTE